MKRIVGSISLLILLLNTLGTPLTYAEEYAQESEKAEVIGDIPTDDVVENDEGEEQSPQFPVNENFDNDQEPEIDPIEPVNPVDFVDPVVENPKDPEVPVVDEGSGGVVEHPVVNPEDDTTGSGGNQGDEDGYNPDALSGGNQEAGSGTGGQVSTETDFSGGNIETSGTGGFSTEISEDEGGDSGIISNITNALQDFLSTIRFFFVSDDNDYIKESKINGIKTITLEDPENGETITIMDRNLGAEDNDIQSENSYGYYYQWGNNNGFEEVNDSNVTSLLAVYSGKYEGIGYTRDNKFRVGSNDIWEEDEEGRSNYDELWYLGENEEIQGPCPEGYHVPSDKEWNKLVRIWTKIHTLDENEGGKTVRSVKGDTLKASLEQAGTGDAEENTIEEENLTEVEELFMKELKLPKAGNYATNGEREDGLGIYWSRTPSDKPYQSEVFSIERYFGEDFNDDLLNRANGNSVRCFLDTKDKEVVEYNKEEITGEETFDDVTVSVYAGTGFFPEGTKLLISPIVQEQEISDIKDKISEEDDNIIEDSKLVAFDISFIYRGEEVQPLEGKVVKVTFDYSNNDELLEADNNDEQEVKVFHIDDKDKEGNKVEKGEEVVKDVTNIVGSQEEGIAVADAESFSVYAVILTSGNGLEVTYNLNGGYWTEDHTMNPKTVIYTNKEANILYRTPSKTGFMFMGWFNESLTTRRDGNVTNAMNVYAKWQEFGDLDIYIVKNSSTRTHYTFMDRNMGATELYDKNYCDYPDRNNVDCTSLRDYDSYGYYYQQGNNYGFDSYAENGGALGNTTQGGYVDALGYSWEHPYTSTLFAGTKNNDWITSTYNNLWGGTESDPSHRQGPCPDGYHVPTQGEANIIINEWNAGNYRNATNSFGDDFLMPAAAYRARGDLKVAIQNAYHYRYLTSTYKRLWGDKNDDKVDRPIQTLEDKISNGYSVRCIKNDENPSSTVLDINNIDLRGGEKAIISVLSSGEIVSLQNPIRNTSDEFRGWYKTSDYSGDPIGIGSGLSQGDHLYAKWCTDGLIDNGTSCVNAYVVSFDSNGGSDVPNQYINPGNKAIRPADPEKEGYSFGGWYYTGLETEFDFETSISSNITIYAKWNLVDYHITYNLNGGTGLDNTGIYTIETDTFTLNNPSKDDYIFEGWSGTNLPECSIENTLTCVKTVTISQGSTGDRIYEAIWGYIKYDLIFNSLGGSEVESQRIIIGNTGTKPVNPTKDGYSFDGWFLTGLETSFDFTGTVITGDITVYAKWNLENYTITYHLDGGTGLENTGIYTIETNTFTLNNPSKINYVFAGWTGTDLSSATNTLTIAKGSTGDREYYATYSCEFGTYQDGKCVETRNEDGSINFEKWQFKEKVVDLSVPEYGNKIIILDRNLGAISSGTTCSIANPLACGFYYQWGNNYGFTWGDIIKEEGQVDAGAYGPSNPYLSGTFLYGNNNWDSSSNSNLWGGAFLGSGDSVRQGPCPVGYHVPTYNEWEKTRSQFNEWIQSSAGTTYCNGLKKTQCFSEKFGLPYAGFRSRSDGSKNGLGTYLEYWASNQYSSNNGYRLFYQLSSNDFSISNEVKTYGFSVRCFKDSEPKKLRFIGSGERTTNLTGTVRWREDGEALPKPAYTGYYFEGWYTTSGYDEGTRATTNAIADYSDRDTVTLYAKWRNIGEIKVSYNVNGGYFPGDSDKIKDRIYEESYSTSGYYVIGTTDWKTPSRTGWMFAGWYLTGLETRWTGYLENDIMVYAKWLPFEDYNVKLSDDITITIMDRNLGAEASGTGCSNSDLSTCGYHFQWGNNYGFEHQGNGNSFPNGEEKTSIRATDWQDSVSTYYNSKWILDIGWYIPMGEYDNLRGGADRINTSDILRQGPCPDGYHVPTTNEWRKIGNLTSISSGEELRDVLKLPYAGVREVGSAKVALGDYGRYRSSVPSRHGSTYGGHALYLDTDSAIDWGDVKNWRGQGYSVRCFKNTEKRALSFESKGGTEIASTQTVRWWETITALPTTSRANSTFSGWYTTSGYDEGTKVSVNYLGTGSGPVTLYAKWECNEGFVEADNGNACIKKAHTVTITSNNEDFGSVTSGLVVAQEGVSIITSGNELTIGSEKVLAIVTGNTQQYSYQFSGWNNTCGTVLTSNCSIEAEFTRSINSYTITFYSNGGTPVASQTKEYGTTGDKPADPTMNGYVFDAWYLDSELTQKYDFTELIERDIDLFAKWNKETYTISYEYNNGTGSNLATYDVETDSFTLNNPIRTGYTFVGWSGTNLVGSGNRDVTIGKGSTGNREYEANWEANKYEVTYKANGGEGLDVKIEATYDENYEFAANTFTRQGYTFVEWNTKEDGTGTGYAVGFSEIWKTTTGVNLYAKWRENSYNVVYEGGDGAEGTVTGATYSYTQKFNLAANAFTKNGYIFSGWRNGENHYAAGNELSRMTAEDGATVTFTAEWNIVPYSITYVLNDGRFTGGVVNPTTYTIESATINVGNPEKTGYNFLGWTGTDLTSLSSGVVIENGSTGDRTYYANWKARDDIKITVRHYLQDLDANNNTVLTTYSISGTVEEEGTADSIITLSDYQQAIEGYLYSSGKVDGNVVTTTTVKPDGSRIIELFYTRNTYSFAITTTLGSTTEGSSLDGDYYYGAKITLSGDINNDCFVWSGWDIQGAILENNMKQTSFHMSSSNVTVKSSVREKTYNLIFNGNSANSGSMSPITGIRCRQEVALPYNSFVKSGYTFTGWTDGEKQYANGAVIQTLTTGDDVTVEFTAIWDINYYPVIWRNYSGDVLFEEEFQYMEIPAYHGETPLRDADAQYTYDFEGWNPGIHPVTGAQVYTAVYTETLNEYTITWDVDGTKTMETYKYGETPSFSGSKDKDPTEQYEYTFSGWSPGIGTVVGDQTYLATYTESVRKYPVYWLNYNGAQLELDTEVPYGSIPSYDGETPTRQSDPGSSYEFIGWDPTPSAITGITFYRAVFSGGQNEYTITWVNYDNSTLEVDTGVAYGSIPSYDGVTPTRESDSQYDYEFSGWSPATGMVVGDQTYVASYTSIPRTYTVTWKNSDGTIIKIDTGVLQGTQAIYSGDNPSSGSSAEYDYEFIGWNPTPGVINSDTTYTALYKSTERKYLIRFVNGEIELQSGMVEYGVTPVYTGDIPEKSGDAQYSYNYVGWNPGISAVTGDITYEAKFDAVVNKYSVTFVNEDGSSVLKPAKKYDYGTSRENVEKPGNPTKPSDVQYDYEFLRWIPVVSQITGDVEFKATYTGTIRTYTVTWKNDDGTVLETDYNVPYGTTPSYNSATPTKQGSSQYEYTFIGWDLEISPVNGDITYTAQFSDTTKTYTITWKNGNTVLETDYNVAYGSIPSYDGAIPTKDSDAQYDYEFSGWNPATGLVVGDQTYVANFISKLRTYTVKWKNGNIVLKTDNNVPYGTTPSYGATPVKTGTAQYSYSFDKWTPDVGPISSDTIYNAIFKESINKYVVTWENDDGSFLDSGDVSYGETPVYSGPTPTKAATPQYTYTFSNHWNPEVTSVTTGAKYTAKFNSTVNKYTIKFVDGDGNVLQSGQLEYGVIPEYTGADPTKTADAQYTYEFNNKWSPAISEVTGDLTYEAQFDSTVNKYTITWKDGDNKTLKTEQVAYGTTPSYDGETPTKTATAQYTYTFNNTWSPEVVSVTNNATYTAQFTETVNKYTIRFIDYDDSLIVEKQVDYGTTSWNYKPADPVREGYTFIGWSPSLETVTGPRTYKATYTINQYTVTPVAGTGVDRIEGGGKYDYGTEIVLTGYAKEGYHFEGGYTVKAFTVTVGPNSIDVRIHAIGNTYKVRFQPGEGEGTMDDQEFTYGLTGTLKANSFTRDGYTFTGWSDGSGNVYANKGKVYNLATGGILLFTALWKTGVVPPEPPTPSGGGAAAGGGISIPTEDEHESADLQTGAIVQTGNDDVLSPDEIVKPDGHTITGTIVNTGGDSHAVTGYTTRTQEEMDAYKYAYKYHITTLAPKEAARPDEYVQRGHMAKMVVNYALNVLHRKLPEEMPKECRWLDGKNAWESQEIKDYAEKACALGLMGIDMKYFQPYKLVTRAQFGTIMGRLLWGKLVSEPYYAGHLSRLKENGIMTQIDNPEDRIEIRKRAWLMFMRSEKYFNVK